MELFTERGYGKTTVEDIATRAGLTERTFFRYFTDKREVLFAGSQQFQKLIVNAVREAPKTTSALDAVVGAWARASDFFEERRAFARRRSALLAAHPELQERELMKLTALAAAVTDVLKERGATGAAASLATEAGLAVAKVGFEQWTRDPKDRSLAFHLEAARRQLEAVVGAGRTKAPVVRRPARRSK